MPKVKDDYDEISLDSIMENLCIDEKVALRDVGEFPEVNAIKVRTNTLDSLFRANRMGFYF
jgi:hypothetical protein